MLTGRVIFSSTTRPLGGVVSWLSPRRLLGVTRGQTRGVTEDVIGGYRLVRRLGEGSRADVYLGHPIAATSRGGQTAVKVYRADVSIESITTELHALSEAAGPHVVDVEDVATSSGRPVAILERLGARSLADLLAQRGSLRVGEAITILVPLAQAIARLQAKGVSHGRLAPASVLFSEAGAPVLARFGSAVSLGPLSPAQREAQPTLTADLAALRDVARIVLEAAGDSELWPWLENADLDSRFPDELRDRLFALGPAESVTLEPTRSQENDAVRLALLPARPRSRARRLGPIPPRGEGVGWGARVMRSGTELIGRIRELIAPVRARFWVIGAGAMATLVVALVLVPQGSSDATSDATPAERATEVSTPTPTSSPADDEITGDDPVAALRALLRVRDDCLSAASILCLDAVAQPGSSALAADQALVRGLQSDGAGTGEEESAPTFAGAAEFAVEEQLGGSALVTVTGPDMQPASILMIRSEAGWRIRDYIE